MKTAFALSITSLLWATSAFASTSVTLDHSTRGLQANGLEIKELTPALINPNTSFDLAVRDTEANLQSRGSLLSCLEYLLDPVALLTCQFSNVDSFFSSSSWFTGSSFSSDTCKAGNKANAFWWPLQGGFCISATYGSQSSSTPSTGYSCPSGWKWGGSSNQFCFPLTSSAASLTAAQLAAQLVCTVDGHYWSSSSNCCHTLSISATTSSACLKSDDNALFWPLNNICCNSRLTSSGKCGNDAYGNAQDCPTSSGWLWDDHNSICEPITSDQCSLSVPTCSTAGHYYCGSTKTCRRCAGDSKATSSVCTGLDSNSFLWTPLGVSGVTGVFGSLGVGVCVNTYTTGGSTCGNDGAGKIKSCPTSSWIWDPLNACCTPKTTSTATTCTGSTQPKCDTAGHHWNSTCSACVQTNPNWGESGKCGNEFGGFWWSLKKTCCNSGTTGGTPPTGKTCPTNWIWDPLNLFCSPITSGEGTNPSPTCGSGYWWDSTNTCCSSGPSTKSKRRARGLLKSKLPLGTVDSSRCPNRLTACPVPGEVDGSYECIDPQTELESCGGCASMGTGVDCSAISGSRSSSCEQGVCQVYSCIPGYVPSVDGKRCIRTKVSLLQAQHKKAVRAKARSF